MGSSSPQILLRKTITIENMNPNWEQLLGHFEQVMASRTDEALHVDAMKKLAYLCNCVPEEILNSLATAIGQSGAIHSLLRRYLLEIFSALTLMREVRRVLSSLGGLRFLFEAARFGSMVSRERACQAIGLLRVRRLARSRHVELGVIPVLVELFRVGDSTIKVVAEAGAILLYAELLQRPDFIGKEIAEDVFCILAVAEENAVSIAEHTRDENVEVRERVTGVIAKLSYDEADRVALADTGAVPLMIDLLSPGCWTGICHISLAP
ncbi:hypothetical protein QYF36_018902 [Acer negundo]|nr:hypothetical protein QYF36_018902 [Acer negundo]